MFPQPLFKLVIVKELPPPSKLSGLILPDNIEHKNKRGVIMAKGEECTNVNVGEGGQNELITPLKNGKLPGMDELIEKFSEMLSVMKDQRDISERTFTAIQ